MELLFQADVRDQPPSAVIAEWRAAGRQIPEHAEELVAGVEERLEEIDGLLGSHAEGWTVQRMAVVDRALLRASCWELLTGVPAAVAINEAVEAANELSTEDSGRFINGVLGRIARDLESKDGRSGDREAEAPG